MMKFFEGFLDYWKVIGKRGRKFGALLSLFLLILSLFPGPLVSRVLAANVGSVVINEVAWAGSGDSGNDEWIELYNTTDAAVNLANWHIEDDHGDSSYKIFSGTIQPHGYFLIEDHEAAITNLTSDMVVSLSLANTGDTLQLFDSAGILIDEVNGSGGMWPAGSNITKATMERKDPLASGNSASNWVSSTGGSGAKSSGNSVILGTPKAKNSVPGTVNGGGVVSAASVVLNSNLATIKTGDVLDVTVHVQDVKQLFTYGLELKYDPAILHYKDAKSLGFLGDQTMSSFHAGLQNGTEGDLLVAETRLDKSKVGVDGTGDIAALQFDVVQGIDASIQFAQSSFLTNGVMDIAAKFNDLTLIGAPSFVGVVTNLIASAGKDRYSIDLHFDPVVDVKTYRVYRQDPHGKFVLLSEIQGVEYVDAQNLIPGNEYVYQVKAVFNGMESEGVTVEAADVRGLKGDNDRSDRVDGRDLENLANHFGQQDDEQTFDPLVDTTNDGRIDGSDLIDLGIHFAKTYTP